MNIFNTSLQVVGSTCPSLHWATYLVKYSHDLHTLRLSSQALFTLIGFAVPQYVAQHLTQFYFNSSGCHVFLTMKICPVLHRKF